MSRKLSSAEKELAEKAKSKSELDSPSSPRRQSLVDEMKETMKQVGNDVNAKLRDAAQPSPDVAQARRLSADGVASPESTETAPAPRRQSLTDELKETLKQVGQDVNTKLRGSDGEAPGSPQAQPAAAGEWTPRKPSLVEEMNETMKQVSRKLSSAEKELAEKARRPSQS